MKCACCEKPIPPRATQFCSRQCAGLVKRRPAQKARNTIANRLNSKWRGEWRMFRPAFETWARVYWPQALEGSCRPE